MAQPTALPLSPADASLIQEYLKGALSSDSEQQRQSEAVLQTLERRSGFCACLAHIVNDKQANHSARWLAVVQLKNHISKFWRGHRDQPGLHPDEKLHLRQYLLQLIPQEEQQVAVQVGVIFAKIARFDYPKEWPSLFQDVLACGEAGGTLAARRTHLVLHHVLKELSSKRLVADQKNFQQIAEQLFERVWGQWCSDTQVILSAAPGAMEQGATLPPLLLHLERWLLLLKVLRRLILFGYPSDSRSLQPVPAVQLCVPAMLQALQAAMGLRTSRPGQPRSQLLAMLDRGILKLIKTQCQVQETHPWSYHAAGALLPMMEFSCHQLLTHSIAGAAGGGGDGGGAQERLPLLCAAFLLGVLGSKAYRAQDSALLGMQEQQAASLRAMAGDVQSALRGFWEPQRLSTLSTALVHNYLPLTAQDLRSWSEDPEAFAHSIDSGGWEDNLRMCIENLFLTLLRAHQAVLCPVVLSLVQQAHEAPPPGVPASSLSGPRVNGIPSVLLSKEAAYNAASLGAYELAEHLDFSQWLRGVLLQELSDTSDEMKPVRRRAAKLTGAWVAAVADDDRPAIYRALLSVLGTPDVCLQLAAVEALRLLIDDCKFEEAPFLEFVAPTMQLLTATLQTTTELETHTQVFYLMNIVIERMGETMRPFVPHMLGLLPRVWDFASDQPLLRIQVLTALKKLVVVLGSESPASYPVLLPLLGAVLSASGEEAMSLMEDGLDLWAVALRHAPAPEAALLAPFPCLVQLMGDSTEHIQVGTSICSSCILLGGASFLAQHGQALVQLLSGYLGNVNERGMLLLYPVMDIVVLGYPADGPGLLRPAHLKLLRLLLEPDASRQEKPLAVSNGLPVLVRLLLQNGAAFQELFGALAAMQDPALPQGAEQLLGAFLDLWMEQWDSLPTPGARKLCALAAAHVLVMPGTAPLQRLDLLLANIVSVWFELESSGSGSTSRVFYGYDFATPLSVRDEDYGLDGDSPGGEMEGEGESKRKAQVYEADPVAHMRISATVKEKLAAASQLHGHTLQSALAALDPSASQQLQAMLAGSALLSQNEIEMLASLGGGGPVSVPTPSSASLL